MSLASSSRPRPQSLELTDGLDELSLRPSLPTTSASAERQQAIQDAVQALEGSRSRSRETRFDEGRSDGARPESGSGDPQAALSRFIEHLLSPDHADTEPHLVAVGYELEALLAIYPSIKLAFASRPPSYAPPEPPAQAPTSAPLSATSSSSAASEIPPSANMGRRDSRQWTDAVWDAQLGYTPGERIRYEISLPVWEEGEQLDGIEAGSVPPSPTMRLLVSLPPTYPVSSPPQLQLLGRYLGDYAIDSGLFGDITRTYISSNAIPFIPGDVCVFEGLTHVQQLVREWYTAHLAVRVEGERAREQERNVRPNDVVPAEGEGSATPSRPSARTTFSYSVQPDAGALLALMEGEKFDIVSSEPITDRKSSFVGHAVRVTDERQVPLVIHELLGDKKIAKAAHPAIFAYRIAKEVGGAAGKVYNTDYDDDGESQAGARLKHLIEILELENVLVVVSRWYGGIHLGPDRFKHINQAARDALDLAGFLEERKEDGNGNGKKKRK